MYFMHECSVCMYAFMEKEDIRSHSRWLWTAMWLLGIKLSTSERAAFLGGGVFRIGFPQFIDQTGLNFRDLPASACATTAQINILFLFCVYECFTYMYACIPHVWLVPKEARKASELLELELQIVVRGM